MGIIGRLENILKSNNWGVGINWGLEDIKHGYCEEQFRKTDKPFVINKMQGKENSICSVSNY